MTRHYVPFEELVDKFVRVKKVNHQTITDRIIMDLPYVSVVIRFVKYNCLNHEEDAHRIYSNVTFFRVVQSTLEYLCISLMFLLLYVIIQLDNLLYMLSGGDEIAICI